MNVTQELRAYLTLGGFAFLGFVAGISAGRVLCRLARRERRRRYLRRFALGVVMTASAALAIHYAI